MSDFYDDPVIYDAKFPGRPGDIDFYLRLAQEAHEAGYPVLEPTCGTGRLAIPIARQGIRVVGLDLSPAMLAVAREKSAGLKTVRWVEADMRSFELPERFGLAYIPYFSFQHLLTTEDQLSCLRCIHDHLVPSGRLAFTVGNPNIVNMGQSLDVKRGALERQRDFQHPRSGHTVLAWSTNELSQANQVSSITFLDEELDDGGAVISRIYSSLKLRYTFRFEMEHLLARVGFEVEALYGDSSGGEFGDSSPVMIWVARRPA